MVDEMAVANFVIRLLEKLEELSTNASFDVCDYNLR